MTESIIELLRQYGMYAALVSIGLNILVTIIGVFPTFFITAANIALFGFWMGAFISFLGESLGAITAFLLYRAGFRSSAQAALTDYPQAQTLVNAQGREAFQLIFLLRMLPFAPAIVATLGAAVGKVSLGLFAAASTLGKVPALLMEAYAVYEVTRFQLTGKIIIMVLAVWLAYDVYVRLQRKRTCSKK
ncbi:TVP38/TMEM64 family protein [Desulfonatronum thioautotrophicum]|uniref:TVP38/TMEM64 family protein n=1 Tax=Desulfonatronum thioautotrophicum TaxID=617001 RepID=UPI0005EAFCF5|nr:VTT domain-containing protein [Desulfonatronum thioautotrophicum]